MTVKEVASMLRVSQQTLYKMIEQGEIPALRIGTQWRFERERVVAWIQQGGSTSQPDTPPEPADEAANDVAQAVASGD